MRTTLEQEFAQASLQQATRRHFLKNCTTGMAGLWLSGQSNRIVSGSESAVAKVAAKAKRVIYLHMIGGPSQLELFDYRPELVKFDGKQCPQEYIEGQRFAFIQGTPQMLGPQYEFKQHGESGAWISDRLPHFSTVADKVCFIKTLQTDQPIHKLTSPVIPQTSPSDCSAFTIRILF